MRRMIQLSLTLLIGVSASAHAFTCGTTVINKGDELQQVLKLCGDADSRTHQRNEKHYFQEINGKVQSSQQVSVIDELVYERGTAPGSIFTLKFKNDQLVSIETNSDNPNS